MSSPALVRPEPMAMASPTIESEPAPKVDYIEFFDPETLLPVEKVTHGTQMALAVFVGKARLIDNARL